MSNIVSLTGQTSGLPVLSYGLCLCRIHSQIHGGVWGIFY